MPAFSFPSTTRFEFDWVPPNKPETVNYKLAALEEYLEDTYTLAFGAKEVIQADMEEHFLTETDPDGHPWQELVSPAPTQVGILRLTEELYKSATSDDAYTVTSEGVFFRTDVLPDWWVFHEQPAGEGAQRLARRRFIGLSADGQRQIEILGEAWLAAGIESTTRLAFPGASVGRGAGGRFISLK